MKKETIEGLIDLNNGNDFKLSKGIENNLYDTILKLINLNILRKEKNSIKVNNRKLLSKVIEFESIPKYLEWFENKDDNSKIELKFDNFIGGDNLGVQSSNSDFNNPTIQNIKKNNEPIKPTISVLKTIYWIFGILVAITILYVFIIKVFNL